MNDQNEGKVPGAPETAAGGQIAPAQVAHVSAEQKEERNWALLAHVSSLSSFIGIPGFVGPLIVWLVKKDEMPFAAAQAKEALNFQISLFVYAIVCFGLILTVIGALIGIPGLFALVVGEIVFTIIASIKAGEGEPYRYPLTFRLIE